MAATQIEIHWVNIEKQHSTHFTRARKTRNALWFIEESRDHCYLLIRISDDIRQINNINVLSSFQRVVQMSEV